jgi:hypothetical protein
MTLLGKSWIYTSETSTQDQENRLHSTKNVFYLNESSKGSVNKQPKLIFEKPEKQPKGKAYQNEFVQNITSNKDKAMKFTMHSNSRLKIRKKTLCRHWRIESI